MSAKEFNVPDPKPLEQDSLVLGVNAGVHAAEHIAGVQGFNRKSGPGVAGKSESGTGIMGSGLATGVFGQNRTGEGVEGAGVWGDSTGGGAGLAGTSGAAGGVGIFASGARAAGVFDGKVEVNGDIEVSGDVRLTGADCAENFDTATEDIDAGTVLIIGPEGVLRRSDQAYDKRVAGVVSGAGCYRPGIVLDGTSGAGRKPIALMGKAFCKVDASYGSVDIGEMLTTSPTPGHAMRVADPGQAHGAVIGKALGPLEQGRGLVPILITLQ